MCVGAALRGLPLASADGAALHHAAAHLGRRLLGRPVRVAVLRHHPVREETGTVTEVDTKPAASHATLPRMRCSPSAAEVPPGAIDTAPGTATLVACVTGDEVLGGQLRSHVTHRLDGDSV